MKAKTLIYGLALGTALNFSQPLYFKDNSSKNLAIETAKSQNLEKVVYELQPKLNQQIIHSVYKSVVPLYVDVVYEAQNKKHEHNDEKNGQKQHVWNTAGSGLILGEYVLTASHVANPIPFYNMQNPTDQLKEIKTESCALLNDKKCPLEKITENLSAGFALMKFSEAPGQKIAVKNSYKYRLGKSSAVKEGIKVFVVGNAVDLGTDFRIETVTKPLNNEGQFCVSTSNVAVGDSGGMVFALRDGIPELVGIIDSMKGYDGKELGYAQGIDPIIEKIKAYNPKIIDEWGLMK